MSSASSRAKLLTFLETVLPERLSSHNTEPSSHKMSDVAVWRLPQMLRCSARHASLPTVSCKMGLAGDPSPWAYPTSVRNIVIARQPKLGEELGEKKVWVLGSCTAVQLMDNARKSKAQPLPTRTFDTVTAFQLQHLWFHIINWSYELCFGQKKSKTCGFILHWYRNLMFLEIFSRFYI